MLLNQRDVVEVDFKFPDGVVSIHPVIVLSVQAVTRYENTFIGVPISHSATQNENSYSFPLYNIDFDKPLKYPDSHARLHLLSVIPITSIFQKRVINVMKKEAFNFMFNQLQSDIFGCDD